MGSLQSFIPFPFKHPTFPVSLGLPRHLSFPWCFLSALSVMMTRSRCAVVIVHGEPLFGGSQDPGASTHHQGCGVPSRAVPPGPDSGPVSNFISWFEVSSLPRSGEIELRIWGHHPRPVSRVFSPLFLDETAPGGPPASCRSLLV